MKFEEILPALRAGKKVRRKCWPKPWWVGKGSSDNIDLHDVVLTHMYADDWEVIDTRQPIRTKLSLSTVDLEAGFDIGDLPPLLPGDVIEVTICEVDAQQPKRSEEKSAEPAKLASECDHCDRGKAHDGKGGLRDCPECRPAEPAKATGGVSYADVAYKAWCYGPNGEAGWTRVSQAVIAAYVEREGVWRELRPWSPNYEEARALYCILWRCTECDPDVHALEALNEMLTKADELRAKKGGKP